MDYRQEAGQDMGWINREDMLELTRRMTLKRNCFDRIAGAYFDEEGYVDGTFNRHFQRLAAKDQQKNLDIAKAIPFSETNVQIKEYCIPAEAKKSGGIWQMLAALNECGLKNDALLEVFYEMFGEKYRAEGRFAVSFFHGSYDVPLKASDGERLGESEEVYQFMVCAVCPVDEDYEMGTPECGFLFPAFHDRSGDPNRVDVYEREQEKHREFLQEILLL